MAQLTTMGSLENEALKSVSHEDKEVGGERVTLVEPAPTLNPITRFAVEEDSRLAGGGKIMDPKPPQGGGGNLWRPR